MDPTHIPQDLADRFEFRAILGRGAWGQVLRVLDRGSGEEVALKLALQSELSPSAERRFQYEAEALARIEHPSVLRHLDHGVCEAGPYLVTELLVGASLRDEIPREDPLEVMLPVAGALDAVHAAGVLHRDVKPANILRTRDGRTVLLDFGLVLDPDRTRLTQTGAIVGTPMYLPPEAYLGAPSGPPTDWYGWGATLFYLAEGRAPLSAEQIQIGLSTGMLPSPEFRRLDPDEPLALVIDACMSRDPGDRPSSTRELERLLESPLENGPRAVDARPTAMRSAPPRAGESGRHQASISSRIMRRLPAPLLAAGLLGGLFVGLSGSPFGLGPAPLPSPPPEPVTEEPPPPPREGPGERFRRELEAIAKECRRDGVEEGDPFDVDRDHLRFAALHVFDQDFPERWRRLLRNLLDWYRERERLTTEDEALLRRVCFGWGAHLMQDAQGLRHSTKSLRRLQALGLDMDQAGRFLLNSREIMEEVDEENRRFLQVVSRLSDPPLPLLGLAAYFSVLTKAPEGEVILYALRLAFLRTEGALDDPNLWICDQLVRLLSIRNFPGGLPRHFVRQTLRELVGVLRTRGSAPGIDPDLPARLRNALRDEWYLLLRRDPEPPRPEDLRFLEELLQEVEEERSLRDRELEDAQRHFLLRGERKSEGARHPSLDAHWERMSRPRDEGGD